MDNMLAVEVIGPNRVYYKAFIKNIYTDKLGVVNESSSEDEKLVSLNEARLPPPPSNRSEFKESEEVEVYTKSADSNQFGWWPARVKMMKGEFAVVDYIGFESTYSDIVPIDRVRGKNLNPPISMNMFHRFAIDIPEDLVEICKLPESHFELKKACSAEVVQYNPSSKQLIIISTNEAAVKRADLLSDMHIRNLRQKFQLIVKTEEISRKLETTRMNIKAPYQEEFTVLRELMGLAIGSQGSNISQARQIEGVTSIEIEEETNTFRVSGETDASVKAARRLLEFVMEQVPVPKSLVSKVIGKNGHSILDIVNKSGVIRVRIHDDDVNDHKSQVGASGSNGIEGDETGEEEDQEIHSDFIFIGTVECIANAKMLLEYQINHLREVDRLRLEKQQIDEELRNLGGPQFYVPKPRRYDENNSGAYNDERRGTRRGRFPRGGAGRWSSERQPLSHNDDQQGNRRASVDWSEAVPGSTEDGPRFRGGRRGRGRPDRGRGGMNESRRRIHDEEETVPDGQRETSENASPERESAGSSSEGVQKGAQPGRPGQPTTTTNNHRGGKKHKRRGRGNQRPDGIPDPQPNSASEEEGGDQRLPNSQPDEAKGPSSSSQSPSAEVAKKDEGDVPGKQDQGKVALNGGAPAKVNGDQAQKSQPSNKAPQPLAKTKNNVAALR